MKPTKRQLDLLMWFARQPSGSAARWPIAFSHATIGRCVAAGWLQEGMCGGLAGYELTDEGRRVVWPPTKEGESDE